MGEMLACIIIIFHFQNRGKFVAINFILVLELRVLSVKSRKVLGVVHSIFMSLTVSYISQLFTYFARISIIATSLYSVNSIFL